jgi:hypothetical protein
MADIVNLRAARKAQDRAAKRAQADVNAVKFGRTKASRVLEQAEADRARAALDGHARDTRARDTHERDTHARDTPE